MEIPQCEYGFPVYEIVPQLPSELIAAVKDNDVAKLQSLQEAGASLCYIDEQGNTLIKEAIHHKKLEVFDYLLALEDASLYLYSDRATLILATFNYAAEDHTLKLIQRGYPLNYRDMQDNTFLHYAIFHRWLRVTEKLIENGVDINFRNKRGETALFLACKNHLVEQVFLLLRHGAKLDIQDYSNHSCLEMLAIHNDDRVQRFFLNTLYPRYKVLNLPTVVYLMGKGSKTFPKLLENTTRIKLVNRDSLKSLSEGIATFYPEHFKLFIDKFTYIAEKVIQDLPIIVFFSDMPIGKIQIYAENLYTIFSHHELGPQIAAKIEDERYPVVSSIVRIFKNHSGQAEVLSKLVCCFLSREVPLYHMDMYEVFRTYGYCELFKIMLHTDIIDEVNFYKPIMPAIIYEVNMTVENYLKKPPDFKKINKSWKFWKSFNYDDVSTLCMLLDYFALPALKKYCIKLGNEKLTARVQLLPDVPSLMELARNSARAFIINKYKTKNFRQFYTVLECLPIAELHKQIIVFEKKLYLATNT